jgi:hypothetical protein
MPLDGPCPVSPTRPGSSSGSGHTGCCTGSLAPPNVVAGEERHVTIDSSLRLLGLGSGTLEPVATDGNRAIDVAALERTVAAQPAARRHMLAWRHDVAGPPAHTDLGEQRHDHRQRHRPLHRSGPALCPLTAGPPSVSAPTVGAVGLGVPPATPRRLRVGRLHQMRLEPSGDHLFDDVGPTGAPSTAIDTGPPFAWAATSPPGVSGVPLTH